MKTLIFQSIIIGAQKAKRKNAHCVEIFILLQQKRIKKRNLVLIVFNYF